MSVRSRSNDKPRGKSISLGASTSTRSQLPSHYSNAILQSIHDPEKEEHTIKYLQSHIYKLLLENCELADSIDKQDCLVELLREDIFAKEEEIQQINRSKLAICYSIRLIEHHNSIYQRELREKNAEIVYLRHQLRNIGKPTTRQMSPVRYLSKEKQAHYLSKYKHIRTAHTSTSKGKQPTQLASANSTLEEAKNYVRNIHNRLNVRRYSMGKHYLPT